MYSIKAIASLTGLGTETIRAWERRYQAIVPERDKNGRRFYTQVDLERLTVLADLTRQGHAISKLSALNDDQLFILLNSAPEKNEAQPEFAKQIVDALLEYRIDRCEQLLKRALMANEPLPYVRDILTPALQQVGQLWHEGKLTIAMEHMFSACVKRILLGMVNNLHSLSSNQPSMMFATPTGEPHEFALIMCCLLAAEQQFSCYYLGSNVPAEDILDAARKLKVEILLISLLKSPPDLDTQQDLKQIIENVKNEDMSIWLGGNGANHWLKQQMSLPNNCEIIADIDSFYIKAKQRRFA